MAWNVKVTYKLVKEMNLIFIDGRVIFAVNPPAAWMNSESTSQRTA